MSTRIALSPEKKPVSKEISESEIIHGAYFWLDAKTMVYDVTGREYGVARSGQHVETTGNKKDGRVEIVVNNRKVWVDPKALKRPLQSSKSASAREASAEAMYTSNDVAGVFRVLLQNPDGSWNLKLTSRVRKALTNAANAILEETTDYVYGDAKVTPAAYVADLCLASQKDVYTRIGEVMKDRGVLAKSWKNKHNISADPRFVDRLLASAILTSALSKGSTSARGDFLYKHFPVILHRAGGSSLTKRVLSTIRESLPWSEVAKMRNRKGLDLPTPVTAGTKKVAVTQKEADLLYAYSPSPAELMTKRPQDILFSWMRSIGPVAAWEGMNDPLQMVNILTANPSTVPDVPVIESSVQLQALAFDLIDCVRNQYFAELNDTLITQEGGATLEEAFVASVASGQDAVTDLACRIQSAEWYRQLRPRTGRLLLDDLKPVHALYAMCRLYALTSPDSKGQVKAGALFDVVNAVKRLRVLNPDMVSARIRCHFPWPVVCAMLSRRAGM